MKWVATWFKVSQRFISKEQSKWYSPFKVRQSSFCWQCKNNIDLNRYGVRLLNYPFPQASDTICDWGIGPKRTPLSSDKDNVSCFQVDKHMGHIIIEMFECDTIFQSQIVVMLSLITCLQTALMKTTISIRWDMHQKIIISNALLTLGL